MNWQELLEAVDQLIEKLRDARGHGATPEDVAALDQAHEVISATRHALANHAQTRAAEQA